MNSRIEQAIANDAAARRSKPIKPAQPSLPVKKGELYDETFVRFINFKPSDAQKEMYDDWIQTADVWGLLDRMGDDGYKLTVKYDETSKAYNALLMDRRKTSPVCGCILSVRASGMALAICRLVFVHSALAGQNWEQLAMPVSDDW